MFNSIWERYFLYQLLRVFFLFLFCFYGLYILIDFASHTSALAHHHIQLQWKEVARYYLFVFASRAEILIPLALLIAFVKTVCTLNIHHELIALMASGMNLKVLMRPFLVIGFACMLLIYANEQWLLPEALKKLRRIEDKTKHQKNHSDSRLTVHHLILEDGSILLFQNYDSNRERFFDAYWIQSINNIYRIKYLTPSVDSPKGFFIDHLIRQPTGELIQQASYAELEFPEMHFNPEVLQTTILEPELFSLTELTQQLKRIDKSHDLSEKESKLLTAFYWKLAMPWLCLIAIIAPAPFCIRFSRQFPIFLIYTCSLFGLIAFYMLMDAAQVVAKRQVLTPFWAILGPLLATLGFFGWRFAKME